jgi:hypothetical protein
MATLRIHLGEFLLALSSHDIEHYLDLQSGLVVPVFEDIGEDDGVPDVDEEPDRYRFIEPVPSHEGFRWMEQFALDQTDAEVRNELLAALDRRRPFRTFKDALLPYPAVRAEWFANEQERLLEYARSWLLGEEIDAELASTPPEGPPRGLTPVAGDEGPR